MLQRRTPLKTKTKLKRGGSIKRKPARNAPKSEDKARFASIHAVNAGYWCVVGESGWATECSGHTTVSHRPGAGTGAKSKHDQVAAICTAHHLAGPNSIEAMGIKAWERKYGVHEVYEERTCQKLKVITSCQAF